MKCQMVEDYVWFQVPEPSGDAAFVALQKVCRHLPVSVYGYISQHQLLKDIIGVG